MVQRVIDNRCKTDRMIQEHSDEMRLAELRSLLAVYEDTQAIAHVGSWRAAVGPQAVLELTPEARRILGFDQDGTVYNIDLFNAVHLEDRQQLIEMVLKVRTESVRSDTEVRIVRRDGEERFLLIVAGPAIGSEGEQGGVIGTVQDVTDRRKRDALDDGRFVAERDLRGAVGGHQLFIEYQPIMGLRDHRIVGAEALVRWEHPERGRLEPDEFIGLAEETGLIIPLGIWVLTQACEELRRWQDAGVPSEFSLSINVSAAQLGDREFEDELETVIQKTGVPWSSITLEVTETVLVEGGLEEALRRIRERGIHIVVDDFGTKYSALGYLHRLPIDALKIDASFVQGMDTGGGHAVVSAITALGHALALKVTAEGVETREQLDAVREIGCDAAQGFFISRPLRGDECLRLLL